MYDAMKALGGGYGKGRVRLVQPQVESRTFFALYLHIRSKVSKQQFSDTGRVGF